MWDFSITKTLGIMVKTAPFIFFRMVVFFGITAAYLFATGTGAGIGYTVGDVITAAEDPGSYAFFGAICGFGTVSVIVYWIREYILYVVKAGHIAVMVKLIDGNAIPSGKGQIEYAKEIVTARFAETNILFGVDQIIKGLIRVIAGLIGGVGALLPIPGLAGLLSIVKTIVRLSLTYVDEVILGYNMRVNSQNPYQTAQDGVVLYAQNGKAMIKNAIWLSIFLWILTIFIFILMLAPAAAIVYWFPSSISGWSFVLAILFAWALKAALLEPFAVAALMSVYFKEIEGQTPNPEWSEKLAAASNKFGDLKDKAASYMSGPKAA